MSTSGECKAAVKKLRNLVFTPKSEVKEYRQKMDETFGAVFLPNRVEVSERSISGVLCDVLSPEIYNSRRIMIYVHGGCFVGGSRKAYRSFAASLANAFSCRAIVPEFRLAPTHPYPASIEDVQNVFKTVYAEEIAARSLDGTPDSINTKPEFIIMADGSGASMAMALLMDLADRYKSSIRNVYLFSPWLDVSKDARVFAAKKSNDPLITGEAVRRASELYTYLDNRNLRGVSPLKAEITQLKDLPPVYIQCGENELMAEDAVEFYGKLKEAGNKAELDIWPEMVHLFQMADDCLEESYQAVEKIAKSFYAEV